MTNVILHQDETDKDRYYLSCVPHYLEAPVFLFLSVEDLKYLYFKVGAELIDREFESMYEGDTGE